MNGLLLKNLMREIKRNAARFFSIFAVSALGVAFFVGIRAASPDMQEAGDRLFVKTHLCDLTVMCSEGLTTDDIKALRAIEGVKAVQPQLTLDTLMLAKDGTEKNIKLISMPIKEKTEKGAGLDLLPDYGIDPQPKDAINTLELISGRLPQNDSEVAVDNLIIEKYGLILGEYAKFSTDSGSVSLRVVGSIYSPKYLGIFERGSSTIGNGSSDGFAYASGNAIAKLESRLPLLAILSQTYTQAEIEIAGKDNVSTFSDKYDELVAEVSDRIEAYGDTQGGTWYINDRTGNAGYSDYCDNTERIAAVGDVFPVIFFIVATLVSLTTMTRMVDEKRTEMGTLKALGYGRLTIASQYMIYSIGACISGGLFGCIVGFKLFPYVILSAYAILYKIPDIRLPFRNDIATTAIITIVCCTCAATIGAVWVSLREVPASMMRPKAPRPGKRVIFERIGFIWNRLNFTEKVTVRNLLRYKKRFFMSIAGIAGSCALLVTGFGIKYSIFGIMDVQFSTIWKMDIQAYTYDSMNRDEIEKLLQENPAAANINSVMYCSDTMCDAEYEDERVSVHVLGVRDDAEMQGKIALMCDGRQLTLDDTGAIITYKLAELYNVKPGDTISIIMSNTQYSVKIAAIADNYVHHYVYMSENYYNSVFDTPMEYNGFMLNLDESLSTEQRDEVKSMLLSDKRMYMVKEMASTYETMSKTLGILNYITLVLIGGSAMLIFVVMLNLTNINLGERKRELATLRVLGFYDKEMYDYVFRENNTLAIIGAALGLLLGKYLHSFVIRTCEVDLVMFIRTAGATCYIYSFILTILFSLLVNLMMRRHVRSIDMVESLKSAE